MARISEYKKLYGLRNAETKKLILYYWASSQKHKAIFSTREKAGQVAANIARDISTHIDIVEFE